MWFPGQAVSRDIIQFFIAAINNDEVKNELRKQIRVEIDTQRTKSASFNGTVQSYDSLTSGNVNMQAKMAASGYDVYGRTIIGSNKPSGNQSIYKKMKNQIQYGHPPQDGYRNKGSFRVV